MEKLQATDEEIAQINASRESVANAAFLYIDGPCSADSNRLPSGELASVAHLEVMAETAKSARELLYVGRYVGEKPRSNIGPTGLIHRVNGPEIYIEGVRKLHKLNIIFGAEVLGETGFSIAGPHQSLAWIGARNVDDTGPRYLVRPTSEDLDKGLHPIKTFVKCGQDGGIEGTLNALRTIMSETPETRTQRTAKGLETVTTHANPFVGVILRGSKVRPVGPLEEILEEEINSTRDELDRNFGKNVVSLVVDLSHKHSEYAGGGEAGQLEVGQAIGQLILKGIQLDGLMAESYILSGNQPGNGTIPGLSTTDKCIGQARAIDLMLYINQVVAQSRQITRV